MESASQLLYPRYTSLSDAVLYPEGSALPVSPSPAKTGSNSQLPQSEFPAPVHVTAQPVAELNAHSLFRTELQALQPAGTVTSDDIAKPKKPKKKKQKVKEDPTAKVSGPSNAEEAQLMRSVLGFAAPPQSPAAGLAPTSATAPTQPQLQAVAPQPAPQHAQQAQQVVTPQQALQQTPQVVAPQQAQQVVAPQQAQQAQQQSVPQHQQQTQAAPIQPQQQSTFRFGFAAEGPEEAAAPVAGGAQPSAAAQQVSQAAAQQVVAQQGLPGPPSAAEPATDFVARRVFVGGMPFTYEVDAIREYWSFCGEIQDLDVMRFPDTGRFKGIAFITYVTEEGYQEALKCDGTELDGQQLRVQKCMSAGQHGGKKRKAPGAVEASPGVQTQQPAAPKVAGYHVAYVGNLAFEADDAEVQQLFPDCNVTKVRLHTDKATGKSRGFAHVHFLDEPSLDKAMQFNGATLHGRQVKVSYAQRKK